MGATASVDSATKTAVGEAPVDALVAMSGWTIEYCVCGQVQLREGTDAATAALVAADAATQVQEEAKSPRMTVMGVPTDPTGENGPGTDELRTRTYWIAHFADKAAYHVEHKKRPSNMQFAMQFAANWKFFPELAEGTPPTKEQMMQAGAQSMAGSYMGPMWHLEKPGATAGGASDVYTVRAVAKCKTAADAEGFVALCKAAGLQQLATEAGALRYTIVPPPSLGIPGVGPSDMPGPEDHTTVTLIVSYADQAAYDAHRASPAFAANLARGAGFIANPATDASVLEFANTKHFSKPIPAVGADGELKGSADAAAGEAAVTAMDKDGDGKVDASELAEATGITTDEATAVIAENDKDGDGKLDASEIAAAS
eukprot:g3245.t1